MITAKDNSLSRLLQSSATQYSHSTIKITLPTIHYIELHLLALKM